MTTYTLTGSTFTIQNDVFVDVTTSTLEVVTVDGDIPFGFAQAGYIGRTVSSDAVDVTFDPGVLLDVRLNGVSDLSWPVSEDFRRPFFRDWAIAELVWTNGTTLFLSLFEALSDDPNRDQRNTQFTLFGPTLPAFSSVAEAEAFSSQVISLDDGRDRVGTFNWADIPGIQITEDDLVTGTGGNDSFASGIGDDTFLASSGQDSLDGGAGEDEARFEIASSAALVTVNGAAFDVSFVGGRTQVTGIETLVFTDGRFAPADLAVNPGIVVPGTLGPDALLGTERDDTLTGLNGYDTLVGGEGDDLLNGNNGFDLLQGGAGADTALGGFGFDTLEGGAGDDLLRGLQGADSLAGGDGADTLDGNAGADMLEGGVGGDLLSGGINNDVLMGGLGDDTLNGGNGADLLEGGSANDRLEGNAGSDTLDGGAGQDVLRGGIGADVFRFVVGGGHDRIMDFQNNIDGLELDADLMAQAVPVADNLRALASINADGHLVLTFSGGESLTLQGMDRLNPILDDVVFV